jgi:tRNA nucleotidyltransferase/poly(A) polymerase
MTIQKYKNILAYLQHIIAGSEFEGHVFSVGGCERDKRMGRDIKDIDLVVDIPNGGISFAQWLEREGFTRGEVVVYEHYGTAMFHLASYPDDELEAVQTRKESYRDINTRNPETAYGDIHDDCIRRDFTINAFYHNISTNEDLDLTERSEEDLKNREIRSCDNPDIIFKEDPLRILRAIRFYCVLPEFVIDDTTLEGMKKNAERLAIISQERITEELNKIISCSSLSAYRGFILFHDLGIDKVIFPELTNFLSDAPAVYRLYCHQSECFYVSDTEIRKRGVLSYLCYWGSTKKDFVPVDFLKRLKYPNNVINDVVKIYTHIPNAFSEKWMEPWYVRKTQYEIGDEWLFKTFMYTVGFLKDLGYMSGILGWKSTFNDGGKPMYKPTYKLPVDGNDVMEILDIPASKKVKETLDICMEYAFRNPDTSTEEFIKIIKDNK